MSILGGLSLVGVAAFLNVSHAAEHEGTHWSPVCIAIVALAFGSALAVPVMLTLWRDGRRSLALAALAGLVCSESYGFQLSAERLLAAREQRAQQTKSEGSPYALAKEALVLAIANSPGAQVAHSSRGCHWPTGMGRGDYPRTSLLDGSADARPRARRLRRAQHEGGGSGGTGGEAG